MTWLKAFMLIPILLLVLAALAVIVVFFYHYVSEGAWGMVAIGIVGLWAIIAKAYFEEVK